MSFLFSADYYEVRKNGISPAQNMAAYLGGSAIQTVGDNPVTAYRQLVQQYAKGLDGSVLSPETSQHGGGGHYIVDAAGREHRSRTPAGAICDSYHAEMHALRLAMRDLAAADCAMAVPPQPELRFCTDSQSAIRALERGPWRQSCLLAQEVWAALQQLEH